MNYVIMGIDRIGKDTFVKNCLGPTYTAVHLSKPPKDVDPLTFTKAEYVDYFNSLKHGNNLVYNRGHIDEFIYGPIYRKVSTDWLKDLEYQYKTVLNNTTFILLYTTDFSIIKDDGQSLDFARKEEEQILFFKYMSESKVPNKMYIQVNNGNQFRDSKELYDELKLKEQERFADFIFDAKHS